MDGFWERSLKPWDVAGAAIIVEEAAETTDFTGAPFSSRRHQVLATNGQIHDAMLNIIRNRKPPAQT